MTAVLTDEDVVIEQLADIVPTCEHEVRRGETCGRVATWATLWTCGCCDLVCNEHYKFMMKLVSSETLIRCADHGCRTNFIRAERL